jgi:ribosomal protein S18 acetylase RimI-like enzyme
VKLPAGYASRPRTWDDLDAVVALFKACDLADDGVEDPVHEHLEYAWRIEAFALERDAVLVFAPDGSLAAYAEAFGLNPELSVEGYVQVSPAHRGNGVGTTLAAWVERRASSVRRCRPSCGSRRPRPTRAPTRSCRDGDSRTSAPSGTWNASSSRTLPPCPVALPEGIVFRPYRHPDDGVALYDAIEEAFADHWGQETSPFDLHMEEMQRHDPSLVDLANEGDEVVGACVARIVEGEGWIDVVAVRRPWRGRGIARALLTRSFAELARRGHGRVLLNVDSENATGATRLYESAGMRVRRTFHVFEKPLAAG